MSSQSNTPSQSKPPLPIELSVGEVARRSGVPISTLHFYEAEGLIRSRRNAGNQRRYPRGILRRVAIVKVAQRAGVPLREIGSALACLPKTVRSPRRIGRECRVNGKPILSPGLQG